MFPLRRQKLGFPDEKGGSVPNFRGASKEIVKLHYAMQNLLIRSLELVGGIWNTLSA
jgi:hypothetical protein